MALNLKADLKRKVRGCFNNGNDERTTSTRQCFSLVHRRPLFQEREYFVVVVPLAGLQLALLAIVVYNILVVPCSKYNVNSFRALHFLIELVNLELLISLTYYLKIQ